jgi:hypothetical protein
MQQSADRAADRASPDYDIGFLAHRRAVLPGDAIVKPLSAPRSLR